MMFLRGGWGGGGGISPMSEVPPCHSTTIDHENFKSRSGLQGYLAHKKTPTPVGHPQDSKHRPAVWSQGVCVFLWARHPCIYIDTPPVPRDQKIPSLIQGLLEIKGTHRPWTLW